MTEKITKTKHIRQQLESLNNQQYASSKKTNKSKKYQGLRLNWRDVVILVWLLFFVGLYQVQAYAQNPIALNDVNTPMMLSYDGQKDQYSQLQLVSSVYDVNITGIVAQVNITQTFYNGSEQWIDQGVYAFPLASNAAVDGMQMRIGQRLITAEIHEKKQAQQIYDEAKSAGYSASMVKQYRPNLFTTNVANIKPYEAIEVQISYQQTLVYDAGHIDFHLPLAIKSRHTQQPLLVDSQTQIDTKRDAQQTSASSSGINDQKRRAININLTSGFALSGVKSLHHDVTIDNGQHHQRITLADNILYDQHDFVLRWYPKKGHKPQAAMFSEKLGGTEYALLMLLPPEQVINLEATNQQKREVVFIIDTSGSMHGQALSAAKDALFFGLTQLTENDKFNIIEFNSYAQALFKKTVDANNNHIDQAVDFIDGLSADGGTNMAPALSAATQQAPSDQFLKQIIFITDGSIGNEAQLFNQISQEINSARLFTVAIGAAPNNYFMEKAAVIGRGSYTNVAKLDNVDEAMNALFVKLKSPALTDIMVDWGAHDVQQSPQVIPDLYRDEAVIVTAKMSEFDAQAVMSGFGIDQPWSQAFTFNHDGQSQGVARLWARQYIEQLTDDLMLGADQASDLLQEEITEVALSFHLVSEFTSLVAVDKTPQLSQIRASQALAVQAPTVVAKAAFSQTSLGWQWQMLLGMMLLFSAIILYKWS